MSDKLTNSSNETEIASLLSGDTIFSIPYFQRPYRWKTLKLKQLNLDILSIIDASEPHFLGALIIHGRKSNPSDPKVYDVIDGQQRITTLVLYLGAIVRVLCDEKEFAEAAGLFLKYMVIARETNLPSNMKLLPGKEDRAQLNYVYSRLLSDEHLKAKLGGFKLKLPPSTGGDRGRLRQNYLAALRFVKDQLQKEGIQRVRAIYAAITESISVVQIDVMDPTNGPKIFDGLNSRQEPMTTGDLVRNEVFSRVASKDPSTIDQIDEHSWQPFYQMFNQDGPNLFDSYFFPYGLAHNPNLKKSDVYNALREQWRDEKDPSKIIEELSEYQKAFVDIVTGSNRQSQKMLVAKQFALLKKMGLPSSTYPFLMRLSNGIRDKEVPEADGIEALKTVEAVLVRRAICGHEPTGLHAVFKRLWSDCKNRPDIASVTSAIKKHRTVVWPNDDDVKSAIQERPLYGTGITPFLLTQFDAAQGGDVPERQPWIEHVLPENPSPEWFTKFSKSQHERLKDTLANLIPLSEEMNRSLSNKAYSEKKRRYLRDSAFKSTREFASSRKDWTPAALKERGNELAEWAIGRWPLLIAM